MSSQNLLVHVITLDGAMSLNDNITLLLSKPYGIYLGMMLQELTEIAMNQLCLKTILLNYSHIL